MEFWIEIVLIIVVLVVFCLFLRWVIIEWKNRLLLGGYFKQNAELLREAARQQSRARYESERAQRASLAPRNIFVHIPPPAFEDAVKMSPIFYIDIEDPPTYADALKLEVGETPEKYVLEYNLNNSKPSHEGNSTADGIILNVHTSITIEHTNEDRTASRSDSQAEHKHKSSEKN